MRTHSVQLYAHTLRQALGTDDAASLGAPH
jgi:hypothetical protein